MTNGEFFRKVSVSIPELFSAPKYPLHINANRLPDSFCHNSSSEKRNPKKKKKVEIEKNEH